jgi:hypothetical protein
LKKERKKIQIENSIAYKWRDYPAKAAIVFVHGLGGDSQETWGDFPKLVMGSSLGQNFDVISYRYSSNKILPGSPDLNSLISEFNSFCQSELREYEIVALISHSLGSVLVNGMLLKYENSTLSTSKYTSHLMITPAFLGGPKWSILSGSKTSRQLASGSKELIFLHQSWKSSKIKDQIKSFVIYGSKDKVVPIPKSDFSEFSFHEHRIQSDHVGSPKVKDIDSALFRGVLYAIEISLRFNTRDSRKYYINMILKTDKSDWSYDSSKEEWVLLNDFRFTIIEISRSKMSCNFNSSFQDTTAYQCKYSFRYHEISLYEFYLWDIDGGRYLVPAPLIVAGNSVVENYNYRLAQLLEAGGMYEDLDSALSMAKITVDETKNVI